MGPDLSNIGGARALPQLYQSLVDPDAEISPGYQGAQVLLKNGKALRGVARNRTNYSLQLQDESGKLHLISTSDIPDHVDERLTDAEGFKRVQQRRS